MHEYENVFFLLFRFLQKQWLDRHLPRNPIWSALYGRYPYEEKRKKQLNSDNILKKNHYWKCLSTTK